MDAFSLAGLNGLTGDAIREMPADRAGPAVSSQFKSPQLWVCVAINLKRADFLAHQVRPFQTLAGKAPHEIVDSEEPRPFGSPNPFDSCDAFRSQTLTFQMSPLIGKGVPCHGD